MNISAPFIRRPIGTILLAIGVFLLGGVSYFLLPVASLPSSDFPAVFIATQYPGASPENMASTVAAPIERRVGEIAGVTDLSSVNSLGGSVIIALFDLSRNVAAAARDVQAALNAAATDLPTGLPNVPIFRKANPNNIPVLILAVTSESLSPSAVYDAVDTVLIQRISQVAGVSDVSAAGADQPAIRVTADPERLSSMGLGQDDVRTAIVNANALSPTGAIDGQIYGRAIATDDQLKTLDDYKSLVVKNVSGRSVLLSDVANVENGTRNGRAEATFNGKPAILIYVRKQSSANVIETVDHVKALIPDIKRFMPAGIDVSIVNDRTTSIRASVNDMLGTLFATIVLVMMVVFVFLRRITPVAAAAVTVPLALAGTFAMMYLVGFSIDNISLMALATSVGFVVDDAIVMIENIDKARASGLSPMQAALVGSRQIGFTVISISVSLMAAFIPLLLLGGISGILFREFSVTLAFTIIISTVASLTITPMICANFVSRRPRARSRFDRLVEGVLARVVALYAATLRIVLRRKALMLLVMAGTIGLTVFLFAKTPKGLFPEDDTDLIMGTAEGSSAISYQALVPLVHRAAEMIHDDPAVGQVGASVGNTGSGPNSAEINQGKLLISLKPVDQLNGQSTAEIVARLRKKLKTIVGLDTFLIPRADLHFGGRDTKAALSLTLTDSDYGELTRLYPAIEERIKKVAGTADVNNDHESSGLQANVVVDRLAASRMLVTMANIDNSLNNAFAQRQISTIYSPRNQYRVVLESPPHQQRSLDDILSTYVPAGVSLQTGTALSGGSVQTALNTSPNNGQAQTSTTGASTQTSTSSTNATSAATANITAVQGTTSGGATVTANPTGQIRLQSMAHVEVGTAPLSVNHQGQFPEVTISFNLKPGAVQQQVSNAVLAAVAEMHLPDTLHYAYTGDALLAMQSAGGQGPLLWAALISVYIVLGVLYESFAHPLTIISTLPSAGLGALLALNITGTELSLIAFIGLILLIGIVKKNGIMLVDFALNAERQRGLPAEAAIYEACIERFRPILMTTLAALLGAMPLILSMGPGSALRRPLGITIAGGLIVSQMLTLYTTPVIYLYLDKLHHRLRRIPRRFGRGRGVAPAE